MRSREGIGLTKFLFFFNCSNEYSNSSGPILLNSMLKDQKFYFFAAISAENCKNVFNFS